MGADIYGYAKTDVEDNGIPETDERFEEWWAAISQGIIDNIVSALPTPPTWTGFTFQNSWTNVGGDYETGAYFKDGTERVYFKGSVKNGTPGQPIATLPASARPPKNVIFKVYEVGTGTGTILVQSNGEIIPIIGLPTVHLSLDGISFSTV
jgi:hypothetical protein